MILVNEIYIRNVEALQGNKYCYSKTKTKDKKNQTKTKTKNSKYPKNTEIIGTAMQAVTTKIIGMPYKQKLFYYAPVMLNVSHQSQRRKKVEYLRVRKT